tara:strand:- start:2211 stop:2981 length:771 start_codon:yes stop_codon:yes gene_type:complete
MGMGEDREQKFRVENYDFPPMNEAYYKARRNFNLFSGLLLGWEYLGVTITRPGEATADATIPGTNLKATILNPEAIPFVVFLLVMFFGFRWLVEFFQNNVGRRKTRPSVFDFWASAILSIFAIAVYLIQQLSDVRIADNIGYINDFGVYGVTSGIILGFLCYCYVRVLSGLRKYKSNIFSESDFYFSNYVYNNFEHNKYVKYSNLFFVILVFVAIFSWYIGVASGQNFEFMIGVTGGNFLAIHLIRIILSITVVKD